MADELSVFPPSTGQDAAGRLALAGVALADIADRLGTPAFVVDEAGLRATATRTPSRSCTSSTAR